MDGNLKPEQPVAFIVHVPDSMSPIDLLIAKERVTKIELAVLEMNMIPYVEAYARILLDVGSQDPETRLREENISMIRNGGFDIVHISGAMTSSYVREIMYWAFRCGNSMFFHPTEGSLLERYSRICSK